MFPLNTSGRATINVKIEEPAGGRVIPKWDVSDNVRLEVRLWGKKERSQKLTQTQGSWYGPKVKLVGPDPYICCIATEGSYLHSQSSILEAIRHPLWHMYTCLYDVKILHDTVQYLLRHLQSGRKKCYIYSKFSVCFVFRSFVLILILSSLILEHLLQIAHCSGPTALKRWFLPSFPRMWGVFGLTLSSLKKHAPKIPVWYEDLELLRRKILLNRCKYVFTQSEGLPSWQWGTKNCQNARHGKNILTTF